MASHDKAYIYGKHAVAEALTKAPHALEKVFLAEDFRDDELRLSLQRAHVRIGVLSAKQTANKEIEQAAHQGVIGVIDPSKLMREYHDFMRSFAATPNTLFVILGEVQDPHNVGAIIRSAAAFGASAIFMPEHNQAPITGTVAKVSAGMVFHIPLVTIGNINTTIGDLKERGFWIYGLASEATEMIGNEAFDTPSALILGNESTGIREKTREHCDKLLAIPMAKGCESLNVAASAAVAMYAWSVKHPKVVGK